jgi:hypothetical protein
MFESRRIGTIVTPTAKNPSARESRFTGPGKGCLFFVTFFGASKESKANNIFYDTKYSPRIAKSYSGRTAKSRGLSI